MGNAEMKLKPSQDGGI